MERLKARAEAAAKEAEEAEKREEEADAMMREYSAARRYSGTRVGRSTARPKRTRGADTLSEALTKAVVKELQGTTGRRLVRGILGGLFKGR